MKPSAPFFSIVIPALNEEKYLPHLLEDLSNQTNQDFEVIVIDGNSDDGTVTKAEAFASKLNITVKTVKKRNVSFQRNTGGKLAKYNWIIFMDADNRLPPYLLDGVRYQLSKSPKTDIFTLWIKVDSTARIDKTLEQALNFGMELYNKIGKAAALGSFIGCRKSVVNKIKFDEKQKYAEDGMFTNAAKTAGFVFSIFREPSYFYSLRRIQAGGVLHNVQKVAQLQLQFLRGRNMYDVDYPMLGGAYYDTRPEGIVKKMHDYINHATQQQVIQARKLFRSLRN